jgi:hypothetical protein
MKRFELGFDPFPQSPLLGLHMFNCEFEIDKKWHPTLKFEIGFVFFKISLTYINYKS